MNIEEIGLVEMNSQELQEVDGGDFGWQWLASQIIDNWSDIKAGFAEGYHTTHP